jgi:putative transposase
MGCLWHTRLRSNYQQEKSTMANTYTQIYIHIVFAVQGRQSLIPKAHKAELHQYITGIIRNKKQKLIVINSMPDHVHILVGMRPDLALSDLVRDIKANSSKFINEKRWVMGRFRWQEGFGAFSYAHSQLDAVVNYIRNQEKHHAVKPFWRGDFANWWSG